MNFLIALIQEHAPAAQAAAEHAESPNVFALTANVTFWTWVIFILLMILLSKFAFPAILGYAEEREKRIQAALDDAAANRAEAQKLIEQQRSEIAQARAEAQQIIAEGKNAAEKVRADLLNRAKAEQEELVNRAKADLETERLKAVESVRQQAVDIALAAASKLIDQRLDADNDRRIVNDFLAKIAAENPKGAAR